MFCSPSARAHSAFASSSKLNIFSSSSRRRVAPPSAAAAPAPAGLRHLPLGRSSRAAREGRARFASFQLQLWAPVQIIWVPRLLGICSHEPSSGPRQHECELHFSTNTRRALAGLLCPKWRELVRHPAAGGRRPADRSGSPEGVANEARQEWPPDQPPRARPFGRAAAHSAGTGPDGPEDGAIAIAGHAHRSSSRPAAHDELAPNRNSCPAGGAYLWPNLDGIQGRRPLYNPVRVAANGRPSKSRRAGQLAGRGPNLGPPSAGLVPLAPEARELARDARRRTNKLE